MKFFAPLFVLSILSMNLSSQILKFKDIPKDMLEYLNEMGTDTASLLNYYESQYFNLVFAESRNGFDFLDKKVGFITGSSGKMLSNKNEYFNSERYRYKHNYTPNGGVLYMFSEEQSKESGGYAAAIVYWSKISLPIENVVRKLNAIQKRTKN